MNTIKLASIVALVCVAVVGAGTALANPGATDAGVNKGLADVRQATAEYHDVDAALANGYVPEHGCVANPAGPGAMGVHYVNPGLMGDGEVDISEPEVLVYSPRKNGVQLVAVEYLVNASNVDSAPELFGQEFHSSPPGHYSLHAWVWRGNPDGVFAAFNPRLGCP